MTEIRQVVTALPDEYTRGIGQVMAHWAYLEHLLQRISYRLLNLDPKRGRVAVRDPRSEQYISMYRELMELAGMKPPDEALDALFTGLQAGKPLRDLVAHGVWVRNNDGGYSVVRTGGNWKPNPKAPKVSRKITPEGVVIDPAGLERLRAFTADLIAGTETLAQFVHQTLTRLEKQL